MLQRSIEKDQEGRAMNKEQRISLIETYKKFKLLWDPSDKNYHNKDQREDCWREIAKTMMLPEQMVKAKMKSLMGCFRSEKAREKKSRVSGTGSDSVYNSKWFAYEHFDFIKDKDIPLETLNTDMEESHEEDSGAEVSAFKPPVDEPVADCTPSTSRPPKKNTTSKRRHEEMDEEIDKRMEQAFELLENSSANSSSPLANYGMDIAHRLQNYDAQTLACVRKAFSDVMFEADMGRKQFRIKVIPLYDSEMLAAPNSSLPPTIVRIASSDKTP